jgi:A/G-specific adenine glycosylase
MDLGAMVCIARVPRCGECPLAEKCPARGQRFEPLRKQGRFEGSFRQRRAAALRALLDGDDPGDLEAVGALAQDGLVRLEGDVISLPD